MPDIDRKKLDPAATVTLELKFQGVCRYAAYLYGWNGSAWELRSTLERDGNSEDKRRDVFDFVPPTTGMILITGSSTPIAAGGTVRVDLTLSQAGQPLSPAPDPVNEQVPSGHLNFTIRYELGTA